MCRVVMLQLRRRRRRGRMRQSSNDSELTVVRTSVSRINLRCSHSPHHDTSFGIGLTCCTAVVSAGDEECARGAKKKKRFFEPQSLFEQNSSEDTIVESFFFNAHCLIDLSLHHQNTTTTHALSAKHTSYHVEGQCEVVRGRRSKHHHHSNL